MKLPEDKQERQKIFMLIGIGVAAVVYIGYMFVMQPLIKKHKESVAKIEKLENNLQKADRVIDMVPSYHKQNNEIITRILDVSENKLQIIHPNLGNYLLVANEIIDRHADALNIQISGITEIAAPTMHSPKKKKKKGATAPEPRFKPYVVNVNLECSFSDLEKLIKALEDENPYLCITRLSVIGQPENVMKHSISFNVQWLNWVDSKQPIKLIAQQMIAKSRE